MVLLDPVFDSHHGSSIVTVGIGPWIAVCANVLALAVLSFGRRYLHRESGFLRFALLCLVFVLGFDLVAVGGSMDVVLVGWELVGLASTFLIGFYGDRSSARRNAVFAFACYRVADVGLTFAMVVLHHDTDSLAIDQAPGAPLAHVGVFATGLIVAAVCKSSQFPLTSLFTRSMEGPTPTSALGYAGLSAHIGVVLLARTAGAVDAVVRRARCAWLHIGLITAIHAQLVSPTPCAGIAKAFSAMRPLAASARCSCCSALASRTWPWWRPSGTRRCASFRSCVLRPRLSTRSAYVQRWARLHPCPSHRRACIAWAGRYAASTTTCPSWCSTACRQSTTSRCHGA